MPRYQTKALEIPPGFSLGATFNIQDFDSGTLIELVDGTFMCFLGYQKVEQPHDLPYFHPRVAAKDKDGISSYRFVKLDRGTLARCTFLRETAYYRMVEEKRLLLPSGANSSFGVFERTSWNFDERITRLIFGGTRQEIELVATALAKVVGRMGEKLPRLTFSRTRSNPCDLTGCLIPKDFPYLTFDTSESDWGHVSLHGFFRLLAFLCRKHNTPIYDAIISNDVEATLLDRFLNNGDPNLYPIPSPTFW